MRLMPVICALFFPRESLQGIPLFAEQAPSLVSQISCLENKLKYQFKRKRDVTIFVNESNEYDSSVFGFPVVVVSRPELLPHNNNEGVLITLLDGRRENDFPRLSALQGFRSRYFLWIVCASSPDCSSKIYMKRVTKIWNGTELLYVARNNKGIVNLYKLTTTVYGKCGVPTLRRIGDCSKKNTSKRLSTKWKIDYNGCPLRVAVWSDSPYAENCTTRNIVGYCSPDSRIIRHLGTMLNATLQHIQATSPHDVSVHVNSGKADIGWGNLLWEMKGNGYYTKEYRYVRGTIIASRSMVAGLESPWADFVAPLSPMVWLCLVITIIFIMIVRRIPGLGQITTFDIVAVLSGQAIRVPTSRLPLRFFFFNISFFGAICIQMYLINRAKLLSTPAPSFWNTMDQVENSRIPIWGLSTARQKFRDSHPRIYEDFLVVEQTEYFGNVERLISGGRGHPTYVEETDEVLADWPNVRAIDTQLTSYRNVMIAGYPSLLEAANKIITDSKEFGLLKPVANQGSTVYYSRRKIEEAVLSAESQKILRLDTLQGTFFVLVIGYHASLIAFISELISRIVMEKYQRIRRIPENNVRQVSEITSIEC